MPSESDSLVASLVRGEGPALSIVIDAGGVVVEANAAAQAVLGASVVGAPFASLLLDPARAPSLGTSGREPARAWALDFSCATGLPQTFRCWFVADEGRTVVLAAADAVEQEALRRELVSLGQELAVSTRALQKSNAELAASKARVESSLGAEARRHEVLHRAIARHFPNGTVSLFDRDLRCELVDGTLPTLAADASSLVGRRVAELFPADVREVVEPAMRAALRGVPSEGEVHVAGHDVRFTLQPVPDEHGEVTRVLAMTQRVTEENRLRAQLQQAQKLESIGRLAGGVAHDFNNLLTVILGCADEARSAVAEGQAPDPEAIDDILAAARRAAELTKQLLAFARKQVIAPVTLDLNVLLTASERLLARVIGEDVAIELATQPGLGAVRADPGLVGQVVINLAVNARDAMPRGGKLWLSTANVHLAVGEAPPAVGMPAGDYVRLRVRDSGEGMSPETLAHLFEPFFTTKPSGVGTGLGLATVWGIVQQSSGYLAVASTLGAGTTFDVYFPRADGVAERPSGSRAAAKRGSETLLVVEDDALVRAVTVRALRSGGYQVLAAAGAREACELVRAVPGRVSLIVTDVVMPDGGGREVERLVRELEPGIRVLYVSGYTHEAISNQGVLDEGIDFLPKPFTSGALLARVRTLLDVG